VDPAELVEAQIGEPMVERGLHRIRNFLDRYQLGISLPDWIALQHSHPGFPSGPVQVLLADEHASLHVQRSSQDRGHVFHLVAELEIADSRSFFRARVHDAHRERSQRPHLDPFGQLSRALRFQSGDPIDHVPVLLGLVEAKEIHSIRTREVEVSDLRLVEEALVERHGSFEQLLAILGLHRSPEAMVLCDGDHRGLHHREVFIDVRPPEVVDLRDLALHVVPSAGTIVRVGSKNESPRQEDQGNGDGKEDRRLDRHLVRICHGPSG